MVELESIGQFEDTSQTGPVGALVSRTVETVKVYTRHKRTCPKRDRPDWAPVQLREVVVRLPRRQVQADKRKDAQLGKGGTKSA